MVNAPHDVPLPRPVRKREFQPLHGQIPRLLPPHLMIRPFMIGVDQSLKPLEELLHLIFLAETPDLLRLYIAVSHLHGDLMAPPIFSRWGKAVHIHAGITFCLGQMYLYRLCQIVQVPEDSLDLIDDGHIFLPFFLPGGYDPVGAPFQTEGEPLIPSLPDQRDFRLVARSHLPLDLPMDPTPFLHGLPVGQGTPPSIQVTAAQDKLYQSPHGYPDHPFSHGCLLKIKIQQKPIPLLQQKRNRL